MNTVMVEFSKLRRLRLPLLMGVLGGAVVLFSCLNLFAGSTQELFDDPGAQVWEQHLIGYIMASGLLLPIMAAVVASRIVDIEHTGNGWLLAAGAGQRPGMVCRAKLAVLAPIILVQTLLQFAAVLIVPKLLGLATAPGWGEWTPFLIGSFGTTMALVALHVIVAARIESQLVGLALGVIGGFIGVFSMLMPPWLAALTPWGYYAVLSPYTFGEDGVVLTIEPMWLLWTLFCVLVAVLFWLFTRRLDTREV